jgi:hypothetical protein
MTVLRRYEILIPSRFNDGTSVSDELLAQTLLELEERFGSFSCETQIIRGLWRHERKEFRDDLTRVFIDVRDVPSNRKFFELFKRRLKKRFKQLDIWITTYRVRVI